MTKDPPNDENNDITSEKTIKEWFDEGIELMRARKHQEAIIRFEKVVELDPEYPKVWFHLGFLYSHLYDKKKTMEYYRKALEMDPKDYEAWYNLGNEYLNTGDPLFDDPWEDNGDYPEAIKYYEKSLEIEPEFSYAWNNLGFCHFSLKHYQKAVDCHQKAVDLDSENDSALVNLGNAYYFLRDYEKSIEIYEKATELHPSNNQGWICLRAALETFLLKVELKPENKSMWTKVAKNFLRVEKEDKAIDCLKKLIKLDPRHFEAWHVLGFAYHHLKNHQKFMERFEKPSDILKEIKRVSIITTSKGPLYPDVFWLLESDTEISIVPSEGPDENFLSQVQPLPDFNNEEVIKAMQSTDDNIFVIWERK